MSRDPERAYSRVPELPERFRLGALDSLTSAFPRMWQDVRVNVGHPTLVLCFSVPR